MQVARRICSSLFLLPENRSLLIIDLLMCVLDSITHECKVILINCIHERSFNESGIGSRKTSIISFNYDHV